MPREISLGNNRKHTRHANQKTDSVETGTVVSRKEKELAARTSWWAEDKGRQTREGFTALASSQSFVDEKIRRDNT